MPHIARLDEQGMLLGVEDCCAEDHKTCPIARTVALPDGHDMRQRAKGYRWDFSRALLPAAVGRAARRRRARYAELVEGLVQAIEHIEQPLQLDAAEAQPAGAASLSPAHPRRCAEASRRHDGGAGMTQASDLGGIANQLAALYRARVNVNLQALATQHYGSTEPPVMYPNMLWFDSGTGYVKLRDPTNTAGRTVGTIGPPMKWTNVDIPQTAFTTGDVKQTFKTVADRRLGDDERRHRSATAAPAPPPAPTRTPRRCSAAVDQHQPTPGARSTRPAPATADRPRRLGGGRLGGAPAHPAAEGARPGAGARRLGRRAVQLRSRRPGTAPRSSASASTTCRRTPTASVPAHAHPYAHDAIRSSAATAPTIGAAASRPAAAAAPATPARPAAASASASPTATSTDDRRRRPQRRHQRRPAAGEAHFNIPPTDLPQRHDQALRAARMTQSQPFGAVPHRASGAQVRQDFNLADQALATEHEGAFAPSVTYPFMRWRNDTGKLRQAPQRRQQRLGDHRELRRHHRSDGRRRRRRRLRPRRGVDQRHRRPGVLLRRSDHRRRGLGAGRRRRRRRLLGLRPHRRGRGDQPATTPPTRSATAAAR